MTDTKTAKQAALRGIAKVQRTSSRALAALERQEIAAPAAPPDPSPTHALHIETAPGQTVDQLKGEVVAAPLVRGMHTVKAFTDGRWFGDQDASANAVADALRAKSASVHANDLRDAESTLVIQATTLDAIFNRLATKAASNIGGSLEGVERYLRLALKAQAQSCRTLEVLAAIKNPTVFARQANVNMGGQQQVNNGVEPPEQQQPAPVAAPARARTGVRPGAKRSNELSAGGGA